MKKRLALLLCLIMTFSLASCILEPAAPRDTEANTIAANLPTENGESSTETPKTPTDTPSEILESTKYYKIEKLLLTTVRYSVYDSNGAVVLCEETDRPLAISMLSETVVDICVGMGTGISIHKYYEVQNNRFSEEYSYVAATSGTLVAYSTNIKWNNRRLVVRDIFDETVFYKSFYLPFSFTVKDPILLASFTEGEKELEVVYLTETPAVQQSVTLPIRRTRSPEEALLESEKAMDAYEAVLKNEIKVFETDIGTFNYLMNCKTPYNRIPLCDVENPKYVSMDVDGDTVNELVIDCGDTLILRYYEGIVYVYPFTFRNMYYLKTDGSYCWNHTGQDFEYGENQLAFAGTGLRSRELWRIVNDGEPNAEYYIENRQVTEDELLRYLEQNPKTKVTFTPLELSLENAISPEEALEIADEYWGNVDGDPDGACGTLWISRVVISNEPNAVCPYYRIAWTEEAYAHLEEGWESRPPLRIEIHEEVLVNIYTGECVPFSGPEGK